MALLKFSQLHMQLLTRFKLSTIQRSGPDPLPGNKLLTIPLYHARLMYLVGDEEIHIEQERDIATRVNLFVGEYLHKGLICNVTFHPLMNILILDFYF